MTRSINKCIVVKHCNTKFKKDKRKQKMNSTLRHCQLTPSISPIAGFSMPVWANIGGGTQNVSDSRNTQNYEDKAAEIGAGSGD